MPKLCSSPTLTLVLFALSLGRTFGANLQEGFETPPDSAKPLTWWHWIDGNVTRHGITGDLEAMKRAGLGGCYLFSIGGYLPQGPMQFGQPEWYDLLDYTVKEAERLGLVFGVHNCDGWSQSGGPWITPETSMKELTHSGLEVEGPTRFSAALPAPASKQGFYRDVAVVAFPLPSGQRLNGPDSGTRVSGSLNASELQALCDGLEKTRASFPPTTNGHQIEFALPAAQTVRTLIFRNVGGYTLEEDFPVVVESSMDGHTWAPAGQCTFSFDTQKGEKPVTVSLGQLSTRFLRLSFTNGWPIEIGELELSSAAKLHFAEAKAGTLQARGHGGEAPDYVRYPGPDRQLPLPAELVVSRQQVVDLTAHLNPEGRLEWQVPPGRWRILRVGYTSTGHFIHPASKTGRGLECDKLDGRVVRDHLEHYVGELAKRFGPATGRVFKAVETDSWECGPQDWTAGLEKRFQQRTGITLLPWMPLLLEGWIVDNVDASERLLWDWRRFLADQFAEQYFSVIASFLKERHLSYVSEGSGRQAYLYDPLGYQRAADVPMGECWVNTGPFDGARVDNKVAASVAHLTGRNLVATETYTSSEPFARWQNHPYSLKALGDRAFCAGVNQFVFHTFAHQPYDVTGPGFTMAIWGLNCNRANTWWEPGRAWMRYLARCNHLLRQGQFVADVLWFIGEDVPNRVGWREELQPALPPGYDFDACDAPALLQAKVQNGRLLLPSGMNYRVLLLANRTTMRPAVLRKIAELVQAGATVMGPPPDQSPSLVDLGPGDHEVKKLATQLWGPCDGAKNKEHSLGKGRVFWGLSFPEVFQRLALAPDFSWESQSSDAEVLYLHRRVGDADLYFISNQKMRATPVRARFRIADRQPELWDPVSGTITRAAVYQHTAQDVELPLTLAPSGSVFVVFRQALPARQVVSVSGPEADLEWGADGTLLARLWKSGSHTLEFSDGSRRTLRTETVPAPLEIPGPWTVSFPPGLGAPGSATFERLESWPQRPEPGIRYFSGTATYTQEFELPAERLGPGQEVWLDLGNVQVIAEVRLNGQDQGILWKPPFRLNATAALKPGKNRLEVRVTNLWPNRMIGDEQLPDSLEWQARRPLIARWPQWLLQGQSRPDGRVTFCTRKAYKKDEPLLESGLLGPVRLTSARLQKL